MSRFDGQVVIVTGASSGIGAATARRLASEGARVVLVARDAERLAAVRASLGGEGHVARTCDVTDETAVAALYGELRNEVGAVNALVHCAGGHWLRPLQLTMTAHLEEMLRSHVVSSIAVTRTLFSARLMSKEGGSVVWLSSAAALQGGAGTVAYAAAKGAIISASRALAVEVARRKVRVNVVAPGVVKTPQSDAWMNGLPAEQVEAIERDHLLGFGSADDVAGVIAFLVSADARWITGTTIVADGGLTAH